MIPVLESIIRGALERLSYQLTNDLPPMIAAAVILLMAFLIAWTARWLVTKVFKGIEVDRWLYRSGVSAMLDHSGTLRASRVAAQSVYWAILIVGCLAALNAVGTQLTSRLVESFVLLLPRLIAAAMIIVAGMWLGQYLGRSMLLWAVNEELPSPRTLAFIVRGLVVFVAVVVAADTINFARGVFLAAFILILAGAVLAGSLAVGLGSREAVRRHLEMRSRQDLTREADHLDERSLWNHL